MNPFRLTTRLQAPARGRRGGGTALPEGRTPGSIAARASEDGTGRALPAEAPAADEAAVAVPWRVTGRSPAGVIEVEQYGATALHSVRFALAGRGMLGLSLPRTVFPGERLRVALRSTRSDAVVEAPDAMLVLRWFQPDGRELLWPIAL